MHGPWSALSNSSVPEGVGECRVGTDVGFVFFSFLCLPLPMAAVWTPPCLAAAWIPSPQNISPRWVNIVLFLRARGVVVSPVLVPLPSVPLWPGFQRTPGWAFLRLPAQGRLHFPCPVPVILQGVCALPHSPLSRTPAVWGGEPLPPSCSNCKCSWVGNVTSQKARASGSPHAGSCPCLMCPLGLFSPEEGRGIKQDAMFRGLRLAQEVPSCDPSPSNPRFPWGEGGVQVSFTLIAGKSAPCF